MERGLMWLPLLVLFFWLAWAGRNEYTKLEAYKVWAATFDRAKYDIRAVLGQSGTELSWGIPDRPQPKNIETFSLRDVSAIQLVVDGQVVDCQNPPAKGRTIGLEFLRPDRASVVVPFTQVDLAVKWAVALQKDLVV
jgi:hypothetical protein